MGLEHLKSYNSYKIFDGDEGDYYKVVLKLVDEVNVEFSNKDFHDIENLLPVVGESEFKAIVNEIKVAKPSQYFPNSFSGSDELPLGYITKGDLLIIVSSGEFQPMRFKTYVEGVWKLKS